MTTAGLSRTKAGREVRVAPRPVKVPITAVSDTLKKGRR
jgi:hypothetical protein